MRTVTDMWSDFSGRFIGRARVYFSVVTIAIVIVIFKWIRHAALLILISDQERLLLIARSDFFNFWFLGHCLQVGTRACFPPRFAARVFKGFLRDLKRYKLKLIVL